MSVDRAATLGLTPADIKQALHDTPIDEPVDYPHPSTPRFGWGVADIRPHAWKAFGEPTNEETSR